MVDLDFFSFDVRFFISLAIDSETKKSAFTWILCGISFILSGHLIERCTRIVSHL